jgi:hypothetical protein
MTPDSESKSLVRALSSISNSMPIAKRSAGPARGFCVIFEDGGALFELERMRPEPVGLSTGPFGPEADNPALVRAETVLEELEEQTRELDGR